MKKPKEIKKVFVKPGPFGSVRDPRTLIMLPDEGEWKPANTYWLRRIKFQDVVEATPGKTVMKSVDDGDKKGKSK